MSIKRLKLAGGKDSLVLVWCGINETTEFTAAGAESPASYAPIRSMRAIVKSALRRP